MAVNLKRKDPDLNCISNVSNGVNRPNNFSVMNPVKIKSKHKIYKLHKSGSLSNKSVIDGVAKACKESDRNESLRFTDGSQDNNAVCSVNDGLQQSTISSDINESSSGSFPLDNDVMKKSSSSCETTFDCKYKGHGSDRPIQQPTSYEVTSHKHTASKIFADCNKAFTNKHSGHLDPAEPYQKKMKTATSKKNKPCKKGKSSKISLVKKGVSTEIKCGRPNGKGSTIQQLECSDETAIAAIGMKKTKQKAPTMVAVENCSLQTEDIGHAVLPSTLLTSEILSLKDCPAFGPVVPPSASPDILSFKGPEETMVSENVVKHTKTRSLSVKSSSTQKKRKRTYNHLNEDAPQMSGHQKYDQLIASPCMNTVDLSFKMQNSDISTLGQSINDKMNISVSSKQTDCKSKLISPKNNPDISLLGCMNTSQDHVFKSDQLSEDSNFSSEFLQHKICTKRRTPSKCVVVLPEELRESTDKSAKLLSGNCLTTGKSEAIQNLDVVLSQKRSRNLSPANMSPVRLSKDVVSSPVHNSLQLSDVRHVKPNEKMSVLAEWKQNDHILLQTLNSACSETELEDQILESNSDLNVPVLPFSVLFPNTTFSSSSEERSLSMIFDDEKAFDTPTPQLEILKSFQGVSMSEECKKSGVSAEGSVSSCLINSSSISGSFLPAEKNLRDSINLQTNCGHVTESSTTPAFPAELPVRSGTQTLTEVALGTPLISPNYDAALSLYLSPEEHSNNGNDCSLDESCASVGADQVNVDNDDQNVCTNGYMMQTNCLAGIETTSESSQPDTSHAAQQDGTCSNFVSPRGYSCEDESLSSVATKKITKYTSYSTTSQENKASSSDHCVSKETVSSSLSTVHCNPTIQKPGIKTKSVKKVRQSKSCTTYLAAVKNVDKITTSGYIKPMRLEKIQKKSKQRKSICTRTLQKNVENGENCTTSLTNAVVHAQVDQYCTPEKLRRPTHNPQVHTDSDQLCMPNLLEPPVNVVVHARSDQHCTPEKEHETPQNELVYTHSDQHCTPVKEHDTLQNKLVYTHSDRHHTPVEGHENPQAALSSDTRSGIVRRSESKPTLDHLPAASNNHNPMPQTSHIPFRSCNTQESSSLYWFSEVATTYAYGAASSADLQRFGCVNETKLLTNASKEIQNSPELSSSSSDITSNIRTESVNICDLATTNLPSTNLMELNSSSPCNSHPINDSCKNTVTRIVRAENSICERDQIIGTGKPQEIIIVPSNSLQDKTKCQDTLHDLSTLKSFPSISTLLLSDDDGDFEGFQPPDLVKKAESANNSGQTEKNVIENPLTTSVASDVNCYDAVRADGIKRSRYKRTEISKQKRNLRGSSLADLVIKDRLRSIKSSSTKVTSRILNGCTSSYKDNVKKGKGSTLELERKIRFQKKSKKNSTTAINPVRQIEEKSNKRSFPKSSILASMAMNDANADVNPTSISNSKTTTTSIVGSSVLEKTLIPNPETVIEHYICTSVESQPSTSNNKNISIENSLHKSTNTLCDIQDHNDNHLDTQPDEFLSEITCKKTAKGCTVRCRDPRSDPPGTPYECLTCRINNSFHSLVSLLQHIMVVHANAPPASVGGSDGPSLIPADCVDTITPIPHWVESDSRVANEQTPLVDSDSTTEGLLDATPNGQRDDVGECSEAVDCGSDQPGASSCSTRSKDNDEFSTKSSENVVVTCQEHDHSNLLVKRSDAGIATNGLKNDMHSVEINLKKTSYLRTQRNDTGNVKRKTNKTLDGNSRNGEIQDANHLVNDSDVVNDTVNDIVNESDDVNVTVNDVVNESGDVNGTVNDDMRRKVARWKIYVNREKFETYAVNGERSRSSDANSRRSVTLNRTKIEPIDSTSNNTLLNNTDGKQSIKVNRHEGDHNCDGKQRSRKRKRRAGRKSKKVPCLPVKNEYKPPPIVMNPCRPRKGFVLIPSMTPNDVQRLVSVQRKAFNETFKMKRREIIANNKEAGIDVSKQMIMVDGTKRYQCDKCSTSVSTVALLLNHMVTHYSSELARFSCAFCPKTFGYGTALKLHLEKHGNIMRFFCPICKLGLQQEAKLRYHLMLHAQKKRTVFGCKKCDKKFNSTALLAGHSKVHYPDLKYRCRECDFVCIGRGGLSKHVKAEHRKERAKKS